MEMRVYEGWIGPDGSIVIPSRLRDLLGIEADSRIQFILDGGEVRMVVIPHSPYTLETVLGSVPGRPGMSVDFDDEIEEAIEDAMAEKYGSPVGR